MSSKYENDNSKVVTGNVRVHEDEIRYTLTGTNTVTLISKVDLEEVQIKYPDYIGADTKVLDFILSEIHTEAKVPSEVERASKEVTGWEIFVEETEVSNMEVDDVENPNLDSLPI